MEQDVTWQVLQALSFKPRFQIVTTPAYHDAGVLQVGCGNLEDKTGALNRGDVIGTSAMREESDMVLSKF